MSLYGPAMLVTRQDDLYIYPAEAQALTTLVKSLVADLPAPAPDPDVPPATQALLDAAFAPHIATDINDLEDDVILAISTPDLDCEDDATMYRICRTHVAYANQLIARINQTKPNHYHFKLFANEA